VPTGFFVYLFTYLRRNNVKTMIMWFFLVGRVLDILIIFIYQKHNIQ